MDSSVDTGGGPRCWWRTAVTAVALLLAAALAGCGGSSSSPTYPVGGTVAGLTSSGLVLANGSDTVNLSPGATSFTFPTRLASGAEYDVTVSQQPTGLTCGVHGGSGMVGSGTAATSIAVYCVSGQEFVYAGGNLYTVNDVTGALSFSAVTANCCALAIADPLGHYLYAVDFFTLGLDTFAINPATGFITPGVQLQPPAPAGFNALVTDPSGNFLYGTVGQQPGIYAYAIGAGATLTPLTNSPYTSGSYPVALAVDAQGGWLYAANSQDGTISAFTINADGSLTNVTGSPFQVVAKGAGLDALVAAPGGGYLYTHAGVGTGTGIYVFVIDPQTGGLTALAGNPFVSPQNGPATLALDPGGDFIFLANRNSNTMTVATVNPGTGALSAVAGSPFGGGGITGQIAPDALGMWVYTAGSATVSGFAFNDTSGALTVLPTSPYLAGQGTYVLVVRPSP